MLRVKKQKIALGEAVRFHGHLGPYLVLGLLAGETALKKLYCNKYFGLEVKVWGAGEKPRSCLIDGLQLSTGATYGKGNIHKLRGACIRMEFCDQDTGKKICLKFKKDLIAKLDSVKSHEDSERLAQKLYNTDHHNLFDLEG